MKELVSDKLPKHPLPQSGATQAEEMVSHRLLPLRQDFDKYEGEDI